MIRLLWLAFFLFLGTGVHAQNTTCATRAPGDNSNACASTAFVHGAVSPLAPGGSAGQVQTNNGSGGFAGITNTALTALIQQFTSSTSGAVPAYGASPVNDVLTPAGWVAPLTISNVSGSGTTTTANCVATNNTVTLAAAIDFANGQGIGLEHCGATFTGAQPTGVSAFATGDAQQGPTGTTHYDYSVACVDDSGGVGVAVAAATITNGNATLGKITIGGGSGTLAYNHILYTTTCPAVAIWRQIGSAGYHLIAVTSLSTVAGEGNAYTDTGQPTLVVPWIPDTPTGTALNDRLVTTISSGAGTTSLTLNASAGNSATGALARHDDTAALNAYLASPTAVSIPTGVFNIEGITLPSTLITLTGQGPATKFVGWSVVTPTLASSTAGFSISNLSVVDQPLDTSAVALSSISRCSVYNLSLQAGTGVRLSSASSCNVRSNIISSWRINGVADVTGAANSIVGNNVAFGYNSGYGGTVAVFISTADGDFVAQNMANGGTFWGMVFGNGTQNSQLQNNVIIGSEREAIHLAESESENVVSGNYINGNGTSIDYGISISDDDVNGSTIFGNVIKGNTVISAGISGIALVQFGGTGLTIAQNIIMDNLVFGANQMSVASNIAGIFLNGSSVNQTQVMGNVIQSGLAQWAILESNVTYGYPTNTIVGPNAGIAGSSGTVSLSGAGSAKLTGGATGL